MKRLFRSYTSFTRPERNGLVGLCALLAFVIAARFMTKEHNNGVNEPERLIAAYQQQNDVILETSLKRKHTAKNVENELAGSTAISPTGRSVRSVSSGVLTSFDPNTVDSLTLSRFGLKPHTIANLLKWRAKGKRFYKKEDLKPLYTLTTDQYDRLAPYINIKRQQIDINHADSITLLQLRGIGPKLAHKIITRRSTVGPFTNTNQLRELYNFRDEVWEELKTEVVIGP